MSQPKLIVIIFNLNQNYKMSQTKLFIIFNLNQKQVEKLPKI